MGAELARGCDEQAAGLKRTREMLNRLVLLLESKGWDRRDIYFLGFSQGGTVALDLALEGGGSAFGGVVSISGTLFDRHVEARAVGGAGRGGASATPALLTLGSRDARVKQSRALSGWARLKEFTPEWVVRSFPRGHDMINSKEEMPVVEINFVGFHRESAREH